MVEVVKKHYTAILKSFPEDCSATKEKLLFRGQQQYAYHHSVFATEISNKVLLDYAVNKLLSSEITPVRFCVMLLMLLGDSPAMKVLRKGH